MISTNQTKPTPLDEAGDHEHDDDDDDEANCERGSPQALPIAKHTRRSFCRRKLNRFVRRAPGRVIIRIFPFFAFAF